MDFEDFASMEWGHMHVEDSAEVREELAKVRADQDLDTRIARDLGNLVEQSPVVVEDKAYLAELHDDGARVAWCLDVIADGLGTYGTPEERAFAKRLIAENGRVFGPGVFEDDPYLSRVRFTDANAGKFGFTWAEYEPYQLLCYDTSKWVDGRYLAVPCFAYFQQAYRFPCFTEGSSMWMSITPNEICTMREPVASARGKVLTLGCGMGYYAYLAARKPEVESVTVIEREQHVVDLFDALVAPQLECADKITVVKADAYEYVKMLPDGVFDYVFADTWIGAGSVDEYVQMKQCCAHFERTEAAYWIEEAFANTLVKLAGLALQEAYGEAVGSPDSASPKLPPSLKRPFFTVRRLLRDEEVASAADIQRLLNPKAMRALLDRL